MTAQLLVPVNALRAGKSRLAPVLHACERRRLNEFFLRHVVHVAQEFSGADRTTIVSGCDDALALARSLGASALKEASGCGLNAAVKQGVEHLRSCGAGAILIIPSDLPLIEAADLREIASIEGGRRIVVCPDKHGTGTNAIFLPAGRSLDFRFGAGSCSEHVRQTESDRISPLLHSNSRVAMDVDDPNDLHRWLREQASATSRYSLAAFTARALSEVAP